MLSMIILCSVACAVIIDISHNMSMAIIVAKSRFLLPPHSHNSHHDSFSFHSLALMQISGCWQLVRGRKLGLKNIGSTD